MAENEPLPPKNLENPKPERCEKGHYVYGADACDRCEDTGRTERSVVAQERFTADAERRTSDLAAAGAAHVAYVERHEVASEKRHDEWKKVVGEQTEAIKAQTVAFDRIATALERRN